MDPMIKHSSGGIVVHQKNKTILLTRRVGKHALRIDIVKAIMYIFNIKPEKMIKILKAGFTKGEVEGGYDEESTARKEIWEEGGVDPADLNLIKHLGIFTKEKRYGPKKIDMFLYVMDKEYQKLKPVDREHIAAFVSLEEALKIMKSAEEKKFLASVQQEIQDIFLTNITTKDLSPKEKTHELKIDTGIVR